MIKEIAIKPDVLTTLITTSGYEIGEIAQKMQIQKERLREGKLTLSQLKKLAVILKRPLAAFFSDEVPLLKSLPDYRLNREKRINPEVRLAQRRMEYLIEKLKELKVTTLLPSFSLDVSSMQLVDEIKRYLNIGLIKNIKPDALLDRYKEILGERLNLIIIEYPLKPRNTKKSVVSDDVRAFSVYGDISGIVLNEGDHPSVKLFSLFHEVCHLLRRSSGICSLEYEVEKQFEEESYCNHFAAEFLVPSQDLKTELKDYSNRYSTITEVVDDLSKIYAVSKQVILLRLLYLNHISSRKYNQIKRELEQRETKPQYMRKKWDRVFKNRIGNVVLKKVKDAIAKNDISFYEALNILDVKVKYAEKLLYE